MSDALQYRGAHPIEDECCACLGAARRWVKTVDQPITTYQEPKLKPRQLLHPRGEEIHRPHPSLYGPGLDKSADRPTAGSRPLLHLLLSLEQGAYLSFHRFTVFHS